MVGFAKIINFSAKKLHYPLTPELTASRGRSVFASGNHAAERVGPKLRHGAERDYASALLKSDDGWDVDQETPDGVNGWAHMDFLGLVSLSDIGLG